MSKFYSIAKYFNTVDPLAQHILPRQWKGERIFSVYRTKKTISFTLLSYAFYSLSDGKVIDWYFYLLGMPSFHFYTSATEKQLAGTMPASRHMVRRIPVFISWKRKFSETVGLAVGDGAATRHKVFDHYLSNISSQGVCSKSLTGTVYEFSSLVLEYHPCESDFS